MTLEQQRAELHGKGHEREALLGARNEAMQRYLESPWHEKLERGADARALQTELRDFDAALAVAALFKAIRLGRCDR